MESRIIFRGPRSFLLPPRDGPGVVTRGATLQVSSWTGSDMGLMPFPVDRM